MNYHAFMREAKLHIVREALEQSDGNVRAAARLIGVHHTLLYSLLNRLNVKRKPDKLYGKPLCSPEFQRFLGARR